MTLPSRYRLRQNTNQAQEESEPAFSPILGAASTSALRARLAERAAFYRDELRKQETSGSTRSKYQNAYDNTQKILNRLEAGTFDPENYGDRKEAVHALNPDLRGDELKRKALPFGSAERRQLVAEMREEQQIRTASGLTTQEWRGMNAPSREKVREAFGQGTLRRAGTPAPAASAPNTRGQLIGLRLAEERAQDRRATAYQDRYEGFQREYGANRAADFFPSQTSKEGYAYDFGTGRKVRLDNRQSETRAVTPSPLTSSILENVTGNNRPVVKPYGAVKIQEGPNPFKAGTRTEQFLITNLSSAQAQLLTKNPSVESAVVERTTFTPSRYARIEEKAGAIWKYAPGLIPVKPVLLAPERASKKLYYLSSTVTGDDELSKARRGMLGFAGGVTGIVGGFTSYPVKRPLTSIALVGAGWAVGGTMRGLGALGKSSSVFTRSFGQGTKKGLTALGWAGTATYAGATSVRIVTAQPRERGRIIGEAGFELTAMGAGARLGTGRTVRPVVKGERLLPSNELQVRPIEGYEITGAKATGRGVVVRAGTFRRVTGKPFYILNQELARQPKNFLFTVEGEVAGFGGPTSSGRNALSTLDAANVRRPIRTYGLTTSKTISKLPEVFQRVDVGPSKEPFNYRGLQRGRGFIRFEGFEPATTTDLAVVGGARGPRPAPRELFYRPLLSYREQIMRVERPGAGSITFYRDVGTGRVFKQVKGDPLEVVGVVTRKGGTSTLVGVGGSTAVNNGNGQVLLHQVKPATTRTRLKTQNLSVTKEKSLTSQASKILTVPQRQKPLSLEKYLGRQKIGAAVAKRFRGLAGLVGRRSSKMRSRLTPFTGQISGQTSGLTSGQLSGQFSAQMSGVTATTVKTISATKPVSRSSLRSRSVLNRFEPPPLKFSLPPPLSLKRGKSLLQGSRGQKRQQPKGYQPSAYAIVGGIFGRPSKKGVLTGLGVRPQRRRRKK